MLNQDSKKLVQVFFHSTVWLTITLTSSETGLAQPLVAAPNSASASADVFEQESEYTLGAGDRIHIEILKLPQYSGDHEVLVNGSLNLPQAGSLSVEGMTLEQAADAIAARYHRGRILRSPQVTVSLLAPRPLKIGVAGEIHRPGAYKMAVEESKFPTVTQALEVAGGITQAANLHQVQVRRAHNGQEQVIHVDLKQLLNSGDLRNDLKLRDGDTVFVPTATTINVEEGSQLASASFAAAQTKPLNILILGEVYEPGPHKVTGEGGPEGGPGGLPTLTQAIQTAGGIKPLADIRHIQVRRSTKTGSEQTIELDLWQLLQAENLQQNLILQDGDTIVVPTVSDINLAEASQLRNISFAPDEVQSLTVAVIGEVARPGSYTVKPEGNNNSEGDSNAKVPTATDAIQTAGGINSLADIRNIQVRRIASTGEERTIAVNLWQLLQAGDPSQDPTLQDGDTIVVPTATKVDSTEVAQIANASFSPETIKVNVVGEVENPGAVEIPPNTPLNQALLEAGGFNRRARQESVELIRLNPNGTVARQRIRVDFAQGVDEQGNPPLHNNDIIVVGRSTLAGVSDTLDTALGPLGKFLSIFSLPLRFFELF